MRLCLVGKFPPIQGGVSARMYRLAHALARRGHAVHVVTNAMEVEEAFRVSLRPEDLARLPGHYGDGYVRLHQTVSDPAGQWHVPWHNPYATKLAGLAIDVIRDHALECVFSWYLEPYGVAAHLAAAATHTPHVVRTAGSDAGRLWHQPAMRSLYDHVFLSAAVILTGGTLTRSLAELGVRPERMVPGDPAFVPLDEFAPDGDVLDLAAFGGRTAQRLVTVGIYGKLGRFKGMLSLLRAVRACLDAGVPLRLAAMVQGRAEEEQAYAELLRKLDLRDHVVRVPFLPHWRVPAFLRACHVVCCLEQDFPIKAHSPVIAQEALAVGRPVLLSQEIAAKQPEAHRLAHGYNCWIVRNAKDPNEITRSLRHAIEDPRAAVVGARGRSVAEHVQSQNLFPAAHEAALRLAVEGVSARALSKPSNGNQRRHGLFDLLSLARREIEHEAARRGVVLPQSQATEPAWFEQARDALAAAGLLQGTSAAEQGVRLALQLLEARREAATRPTEGLFRLGSAAVGWPAERLPDHHPSLAPGVVARAYPASPMDLLTGAKVEPDAPGVALVVLPFSPWQQVKLYVLSGAAAELVMASDGTRSLAGIGTMVGWREGEPRQKMLELAEELFAVGVLSLEAPPGSSKSVASPIT